MSNLYRGYNPFTKYHGHPIVGVSEKEGSTGILIIPLTSAPKKRGNESTHIHKNVSGKHTSPIGL